MTIDFYYTSWSPPCRTVELLASILNIKLNPIVTTPSKGDTQKPEYKQLTPQHTIPTIVDNGFVLSESRAICKYLVEKYGSTTGAYCKEQLYPKDLQKRATIDHRIDFDLGSLYRRASDYISPVFATGHYGTAAIPKLTAALEILDAYLSRTKWVAGPDITLADIVVVVTISSLEIIGYDLTSYPNVLRWFKTAQETLPNYNEANHKGILGFKEYVFSKLLDN
ncbi:glutathione S-transferase 1-1-like [Melanaphis sacchari]|uniref:Glutathione S-transferase 1-1 n=1 Tax=Melanaphis sacchari TaxID=742174 RepID=A0A2H8TXI5_9HEMI|nr:glutathione S-transferase 1-1-like [Melanaphis sacchari]